MKAVIVEIRGSYASVLSDDGCIRKIKNNNYELGQVINMTIIRNHMLKKVSMLAASAAAILILSVGTWAYASPYSYVSLDVNPSIEYVLNRFDRVLKVTAGNEDGEDILLEIKLDNLKNRTISYAINETLYQIYEMGYLPDDDEGGIVIATSNKSSKKADELAIELKEDVENEIHESYSTASVEIFSVDMERVETAKELGVTPGKLNLVEKLRESSDDPQSIVLNEWLDKPVKDIMKATKENRKADDIDQDDLFIDNTDDKSVKEAVKEAKEAAKEAEKAAKEAEKEAKKAEKAAKEAEKEAKEAEKAAKEAAKEAEKAAKEVLKALDKAKSSDKSNSQDNNSNDNNSNDSNSNDNNLNDNNNNRSNDNRDNNSGKRPKK